MRDVLELRQIKMELAAYMGDEFPDPIIEQEQTTRREQENEIKDLVEVNEFSLPTTPALEGSPMLEHLGDVTPLAPSRTKSIPEGEEEKIISTHYEKTHSRSSSDSLKLGPGMKVDLHSLIDPCSTNKHTNLSSDRDDNDEEEDNNTCYTSTTTTSSSIPTSISSSSYSSPPSSIPGSEDNSLSCSPATSDSEFGSGSGTLSSCEEFDDILSNRGSGGDDNTSLYDDDEEVDEEDEYDDNNMQGYNLQSTTSNDENARTPTRVSLLRPGQFSSLSSNKNRKTSSISSSSSDSLKKDIIGKIDIGCIQIALPALDAAGNDTYGDLTSTFDLSPSNPDPWNPATF